MSRVSPSAIKQLEQNLQDLYTKPAEKKYTLQRVQHAAEKLGNPQGAFQTIHITGTNGKGSTAKILSTILSKKHKVGLFTSPHLVDVTERIQINNEQISVETLLAYLQGLEKLGMELTYFETLTIIALLYFRDEEVDYAILEVGMGGTLDATNIVDAKISVLTSISLDHTKTLGDTRELIAEDKCGIIKSKAHVFSSMRNIDLLPIIQNAARKQDAVLHWVRPTTKPCALQGDFQAENAGLAVAVARHIGIDESTIDQGLQETTWPGRMQWYSDTIFVDGAHNDDALRILATHLQSWNKPYVLVFGTTHNRDDAVLSAFHPDRIVFTQPNNKFATRVSEFKHIGRRIADHEQALTYALQIQADRILVVTGSLYLVGDALRFFRHNKSSNRS